MNRVGVAALAAVAVLPACSRLADLGTKRYAIPSNAMEPTLLVGDRIGCSEDVPDPLPRGAVVVFGGAGPWAAGTGQTFVKRVVGLPGERVGGDPDGTVRVDGAPLVEPYARKTDSAPFAEVTVPAGEYFLLGDNRGQSSDSRHHGAIPHTAITSVCTRILSPGDRRGPIAGVP